jgi:hypothetical protein
MTAVSKQRPQEHMITQGLLKCCHAVKQLLHGQQGRQPQNQVADTYRTENSKHSSICSLKQTCSQAWHHACLTAENKLFSSTKGRISADFRPKMHNMLSAAS